MGGDQHGVARFIERIVLWGESGFIKQGVQLLVHGLELELELELPGQAAHAQDKECLANWP